MDPDLHAWETFRASLGEASPVLRFANGVALHLSGSGALAASESDLVDRTLRLLGAIAAGERPAPEILAESPVLLASFFQNLDLLPPSSPATMQIALLVGGAIEIVSAESA